MDAAESGTRDGVSFGPFQLHMSARLLTRDGASVDVGGRALDLLIALTSSPNEVISKTDLMARVWPDVIVEEGSLRFHINGLRNALGDGKDGARYIATIPGRGYCFVAVVSRADSSRRATVSTTPPEFPHANLPIRLSQMIDREQDVARLALQLKTSRVVTIAGAGGIGKTTVAVAVANDLSGAFDGAMLFVDLGMLNDPELVAPGLASMMGLTVGAGDVRPSLIAYLRDKKVCLVLDTCEHLIEAVAALSSTIIKTAPQVHILATSREPLRIDGEYVYKLEALACPPDDPEISAASAMSYPATQLFMERAAASGASRDVSDTDARIVAGICRKLDGVALAVELAARRVETWGLSQTAALLDQQLTLGWQGSRTAPPRQRTLQATLDWSFNLLTYRERLVLRRLAIFVGHFTLDAAFAVGTDAALDRYVVFSAIENLVAKSMVATRTMGASTCYRLLDTTRAYVQTTPVDADEYAAFAARHAAYFGTWLAHAAADWTTLTTGAEREPHFAALNNVRTALEWCFGDTGNKRAGIELAAAAAPAFLAMSLLPECRRWSERAILALEENVRGGPEEMHLQGTFGMASMYLHGKSDAALAALSRSAAIAEQQGDIIMQIGMLGMLRTFKFRSGEFKDALKYAKLCRTLAAGADDPAASGHACSLLGRSLHLTGDLEGARIELEDSLWHWSRAKRTTIYLGHELHYPSDVTLARNLWLQGLPYQAAQRAHKVIADVVRIDRPAAQVVVLGWAASVFLWTGNLESAEQHIGALLYQAETNSLVPFIAAGQARQGELSILRGDALGGVENLRAGLKTLHQIGYETLTTEFSISLALGLKALGQHAEALALTDQTIQRVERNGEDLYLPELLRVKGGIQLAIQQRPNRQTELCLSRSLELSRRQGARAWELRTVTDLADLWAKEGRTDDAKALLQPVFEQFVEGLATPDLVSAGHLLSTLK